MFASQIFTYPNILAVHSLCTHQFVILIMMNTKRVEYLFAYYEHGDNTENIGGHQFEIDTDMTPVRPIEVLFVWKKEHENTDDKGKVDKVFVWQVFDRRLAAFVR